MQSGVSADRKDRKILCMTSVKGVQTKAQPVKTGVAKPDGPKRSFFSAWQPVAKDTFCYPLAELCAL